MPKTTTCEIVLIIDGEGNYGVGYDNESARESYDNNGSTEETAGMRVYRLNLAVPLPVAAVVTGTLPDVPGGEVALTVV